MLIFNENDELVEDPDQNLGYIEKQIIPVTHQYIVDESAVTHLEVIAEYPETGGKDVDVVIDVPERGHWETRDKNGKLIQEFDGDLTGFPHDVITEDAWEYGLYILYTEEELAQRQEEYDQILEETEKREEFMNKGPDQISELENTQEDMILLLADIVGGAQ